MRPPSGLEHRRLQCGPRQLPALTNRLHGAQQKILGLAHPVHHRLLRNGGGEPAIEREAELRDELLEQRAIDGWIVHSRILRPALGSGIGGGRGLGAGPAFPHAITVLVEPQ